MFRKFVVSVSFVGFALSAAAIETEWQVRVEGGPIWQGKNDFRIPGDSGTLVSVPKVGDSSPRFSYRFYASSILNKKHEARLTLAPFALTQTSMFSNPVSFEGTVFAAGTSSTIEYQFNSFRLGYRYTFFDEAAWSLKVGLTAKIRDAKVSITQGAVSRENTNLGFVPLVNIYTHYLFFKGFFVELDVEALGAPQGRAEDIRLSLVYFPTENFGIDFGYRTLEGGADNATIYTFSWFHYLITGLRATF